MSSVNWGTGEGTAGAATLLEERTLQLDVLGAAFWLAVLWAGGCCWLCGESGWVTTEDGGVDIASRAAFVPAATIEDRPPRQLGGLRITGTTLHASISALRASGARSGTVLATPSTPETTVLESARTRCRQPRGDAEMHALAHCKAQRAKLTLGSWRLTSPGNRTVIRRYVSNAASNPSRVRSGDSEILPPYLDKEQLRRQESGRERIGAGERLSHSSLTAPPVSALHLPRSVRGGQTPPGTASSESGGEGLARRASWGT